MMLDGRFREDLYFRLAEIVVQVPSLAERGEDAVLLAQFFMQRQRDSGRTKARGFTAEALAAITSWPWTGNVRELENRVKRATIMADGVMLTPRDLDLDSDSPVSDSAGTAHRPRTGGPRCHHQCNCGQSRQPLGSGPGARYFATLALPADEQLWNPEGLTGHSRYFGMTARRACDDGGPQVQQRLTALTRRDRQRNKSWKLPMTG